MTEEQAEYSTKYRDSEEYLDVIRRRIRALKLRLESLQKEHVRLTGRRF